MEGNNLIKKGVAVAVILLFVSVSVIPSIPSKLISKGDIITVDDEGDGDYTSIKEAVNNANPGDTIEVYSGTYYEHSIVIDKDEITLKGISYELGGGNDMGKPFIPGKGTATIIFVKKSNVTVSNFRIENPWSGGLFVYPIRVGDQVVTYQENVIISNNTISNSTHPGIYCSNKGKDIKIIDNEISHCNNSGILFDVFESSILTGNTITDVEGHGILLGGSYHTVSGNIIRRCGNGIKIQGDYIIVRRNIIENCKAGVFIEYGCRNTISENNFINNSRTGFWWGRYLGTYIVVWNINRWKNNYWNNWIGIGPKPILGYLIIWILIVIELLEIPISWVDFDWHPAPEPYDIGL